MADPLSIAASAAGLISLGIQVTQSLIDICDSYKNFDENLIHTAKRLEFLLEILKSLEKTISDPSFQNNERNLIKKIIISIESCDESIQELKNEWKKLIESSKGIKKSIETAGRRIAYPFRKRSLQRIEEDIDDICEHLSFALEVLRLKDSKRNQDDMIEIKALLNLINNHHVSSQLLDWLKAPDATMDHNIACTKKHPRTGLWLTEGSFFRDWLTEENSVLWLSGFAGSGKSVLCSTAIQFVFRHRKSDPRIGIAFFYFTFNDKSKQDESVMIRALLLQLSTQLKDGQADLLMLYNSYKNTTVSSQILITYLRRLIEKFQNVFIMLDALDESPPDGPRERVLEMLEMMRKWGLSGLHIFFTSRNERDINEYFDLSPTQQVVMQNSGLDQDISDFISGQLDSRRSLQKWKKSRDKIQASLSKRAQGVYVQFFLMKHLQGDMNVQDGHGHIS